MKSHTARIGRIKKRDKAKREAEATRALNTLMLEFSELLMKYRHDLENKDFKKAVEALDFRWGKTGRRLNLTEGSLATFSKRADSAIADLKKVPEQLVLSKRDLPELRDAYQEAVDAKAEDFTFKGEKVLVSYAKYLIEYLES